MGIRRRWPVSSGVILTALVSIDPDAKGSPSLGAAPSVESEDASVELHIAWNDVYRQLTHEYETVTRHVEAMFAGTGVRIVWDTNGICDPPGVPVTHLRMIVRPGESVALGFPAGTMGASLGNSTPREAALIFVPDILQTMDLKPSHDRARPLAESMLLARAVARVVAHEIIHAIVPDRAHDPKGLMGLRLTRKQLTQPRLKLTSDIAELLTHRLATLVAHRTLALDEGEKK